jgi:hypothetical protein
VTALLTLLHKNTLFVPELQTPHAQSHPGTPYTRNFPVITKNKYSQVRFVTCVCLQWLSTLRPCKTTNLFGQLILCPRYEQGTSRTDVYSVTLTCSVHNDRASVRRRQFCNYQSTNFIRTASYYTLNMTTVGF